MNKVTVYYSIRNGGDGSANLLWFLSKDEAVLDQEKMEEYGGWSEICIGRVETFEGSNIHTMAIENENYEYF